MSFSNGHHAFAGLNEEAANDFLTAFFQARPHYLHYGSPPFVLASSSAATLISPIAVPGLLPTPIPLDIQLSVPVVDFYPPDGPLPAPLVLVAGQLAISTSLRVTVICGQARTSFDLGVWAIGSISVSPPTGPPVSIHITTSQIKVQGIAPLGLEQVLECLLLEALQNVLQQVSIPIPALSLGFLTVTVQQGPQLDADELDVWGNV